MTNELEKLQRGLHELGLSVPEPQMTALIQYLDILEITNQSFNLTRIPRAEYVTLHLLDSLSCLLEIEPDRDTKILDVGTGAGFPGVPLAAALPSASLTLLDSTAKKIRFVTEAAKQCGINNLIGVHGRAELLAKSPEHRGAYDVVVSRAVATYPKLLEWLVPFAKKGGRVIAMKGSGYLDEMQGSEELLKRLGGRVKKIRSVRLPGTDIERFLIVVQRG
jgi:16S rRNA (guanine527-N7)-methyltransferase